jgi:hypothetical protein
MVNNSMNQGYDAIWLGDNVPQFTDCERTQSAQGDWAYPGALNDSLHRCSHILW